MLKFLIVKFLLLKNNINLKKSFIHLLKKNINRIIQNNSYNNCEKYIYINIFTFYRATISFYL